MVSKQLDLSFRIARHPGTITAKAPGIATAAAKFLGSHDGLSVDAREQAELAHTIPYENRCAISRRVPRKYC